MPAPILILSNPRTGSTLLRLLLDTHPDICSPGELSLGKLCEHVYGAVEGTLAAAGYADARARRRKCVDETRRIVDDLLGAYCEARGKPRWCEKSPANIEYLDLLDALFPDAAYVCLHRHCLDAVSSMIAFFGSSPPELAAYLDRHAGDIVAAFTERWCDHTDRLLAFEAMHPARAHRVTYEQLVADPDATLRAMLRFLGAAWAPGLADRVFAEPHDLGRGDPKIATATKVEQGRVGSGGRLDVSHLPEDLQRRMHRLLDRLGYTQRPEPVIAGSDARTSVELTSVAELFSSYFNPRLDRSGHRLGSAKGALGLVVNGQGGGAWTIGVDASGARLLADAPAPPVAIVMEASDLLDVVNRRISLAAFRDRLRVQGNLALFDRPFGERLLWVLFGEESAVA
jgi:hypothetical protein